ncbi:MAG: hypothetical protein AAB069_02215 [Planctomycetota bacterium]
MSPVLVKLLKPQISQIAQIKKRDGSAGIRKSWGDDFFAGAFEVLLKKEEAVVAVTCAA